MAELPYNLSTRVPEELPENQPMINNLPGNGGDGPACQDQPLNLSLSSPRTSTSSPPKNATAGRLYSLPTSPPNRAYVYLPTCSATGAIAKRPNYSPSGASANRSNYSPSGASANRPNYSPSGASANRPNYSPSGASVNPPTFSPSGASANLPPCSPSWRYANLSSWSPKGTSANLPTYSPTGASANQQTWSPSGKYADLGSWSPTGISRLSMNVASVSPSRPSSNITTKSRSKLSITLPTGPPSALYANLSTSPPSDEDVPRKKRASLPTSLQAPQFSSTHANLPAVQPTRLSSSPHANLPGRQRSRQSISPLAHLAGRQHSRLSISPLANLQNRQSTSQSSSPLANLPVLQPISQSSSALANLPNRQPTGLSGSPVANPPFSQPTDEPSGMRVTLPIIHPATIQAKLCANLPLEPVEPEEDSADFVEQDSDLVRMPDLVLTSICKHIDGSDLVSLGMTCRNLWQRLSHASYWKSMSVTIGWPSEWTSRRTLSLLEKMRASTNLDRLRLEVYSREFRQLKLVIIQLQYCRLTRLHLVYHTSFTTILLSDFSTLACYAPQLALLEMHSMIVLTLTSCTNPGTGQIIPNLDQVLTDMNIVFPRLVQLELYCSVLSACDKDGFIYNITDLFRKVSSLLVFKMMSQKYAVHTTHRIVRLFRDNSNLREVDLIRCSIGPKMIEQICLALPRVERLRLAHNGEFLPNMSLCSLPNFCSRLTHLELEENSGLTDRVRKYLPDSITLTLVEYDPETEEDDTEAEEPVLGADVRAWVEAEVEVGDDAEFGFEAEVGAAAWAGAGAWAGAEAWARAEAEAEAGVGPEAEAGAEGGAEAGPRAQAGAEAASMD